MVNLTIDGKQVQVKENTTILEAARAAGIHVPSLCYLKDINEIGACRVCVVEVEGVDKLISSCNNIVSEGMVVHTNSPRVREVRKTANVPCVYAAATVHCRQSPMIWTFAVSLMKCRCPLISGALVLL